MVPHLGAGANDGLRTLVSTTLMGTHGDATAVYVVWPSAPAGDRYLR